MANQLKVAEVFSIQALHAQGWSQRRIARELGIHRPVTSGILQNRPKRPPGLEMSASPS